MRREGRARRHCPHQWLINWIDRTVASASSSTRHFRFLFLLVLFLIVIVVIVRMILFEISMTQHSTIKKT
jgi:hypothetical protein